MSQFLESVAAAIARLSFEDSAYQVAGVPDFPAYIIEARFVRWDAKQKLTKLVLGIRGPRTCQNDPFLSSLDGLTVELALNGQPQASTSFVLGFVTPDPVDAPLAHACFILKVNASDGWVEVKIDGKTVNLHPYCKLRLEVPQPAGAKISA